MRVNLKIRNITNFLREKLIEFQRKRSGIQLRERWWRLPDKDYVNQIEKKKHDDQSSIKKGKKKKTCLYYGKVGKIKKTCWIIS